MALSVPVAMKILPIDGEKGVHFPFFFLLLPLPPLELPAAAAGASEAAVNAADTAAVDAIIPGGKG